MEVGIVAGTAIFAGLIGLACLIICCRRFWRRWLRHLYYLPRTVDLVDEHQVLIDESHDMASTLIEFDSRIEVLEVKVRQMGSAADAMSSRVVSLERGYAGLLKACQDAIRVTDMKALEDLTIAREVPV